MSKYNEAELHAIKELDPHGYLRWQLPELDPDLVWYTWLESQVAPPAGLPFLRCDCVAGLRSRSGRQPPWACLVEAQAQPIPRLAVWLLVYLGLLHEDLRHGPHDRDRFQMMAAVLNLTDTTLATTIDWVPPVPAPALPSEPRPFGVQARFWARHVRQEQAEATLEGIAAGRIALCILVWVPLMIGGDDPDVLERWQEVALLQKEPHLLADYVALTRVFAELAGRQAAWTAALKEFNMNDSVFLTEIENQAIERGMAKGMAKGIEQGIEQGIAKGLAKGALVGKIQMCQELLRQPVTPETELRTRSEQELDSLLAQLRNQMLSNGK